MRTQKTHPKLRRAEMMLGLYGPTDKLHGFRVCSKVRRGVQSLLNAWNLNSDVLNRKYTLDRHFIVDACCTVIIHSCLNRRYANEGRYGEMRHRLIQALGNELVTISSCVSLDKRKKPALSLPDTVNTERNRRIIRVVQNAEWWDAVSLTRYIQSSEEKGLKGYELILNAIQHAETTLIRIHEGLDPEFQQLSFSDHKALQNDLEAYKRTHPYIR